MTSFSLILLGLSSHHLHFVSHLFKLFSHPVTVISLDFDLAVLEGTACPASGLERLQQGLIHRRVMLQTPNQGDRLTGSALAIALYVRRLLIRRQVNLLADARLAPAARAHLAGGRIGRINDARAHQHLRSKRYPAF